MTFFTQNIRKPLVTFSLLSALTGLLSTGCSSNTEAVVVKPAATTDSTSEKSQDKPSPTAKEIQPSAAAKPEPVPSEAPAISAVAVGEDAYAVEDNLSNVMPDAITAAEAGEDTFAVENIPEDQAAMEAGLIDANGNRLLNIIEGMEVGMPYAEARQLILDGGIWIPKTMPPVDLSGITVQRLYDMGYEEIQDCSGTGLGLCSMAFIERDSDNYVLYVTVTTSEDELKVWTWDMVSL